MGAYEVEKPLKLAGEEEGKDEGGEVEPRESALTRPDLEVALREARKRSMDVTTSGVRSRVCDRRGDACCCYHCVAEKVVWVVSSG